jgi:hypothetical protein
MAFKQQLNINAQQFAVKKNSTLKGGGGTEENEVFRTSGRFSLYFPDRESGGGPTHRKEYEVRCEECGCCTGTGTCRG